MKSRKGKYTIINFIIVLSFIELDNKHASILLGLSLGREVSSYSFHGRLLLGKLPQNN